MIFKINDNLEIEAETYETRYSWGHKAWLYLNGEEIGYKKATYYNRTWESYEFQSVMQSLVSDSKLSKEQKAEALEWLKNYEEPSRFGTVALIATMGDILTNTPTEANDWKVRMLKAGLPEGALDMPEDWEQLSETEKTKRLDGAIQALA